MSTAAGNLTVEEIFAGVQAGQYSNVEQLEQLLAAYYAEVGGSPDAVAFKLSQWATTYALPGPEGLPITGINKYQEGGSGYVSPYTTTPPTQEKLDYAGGGGGGLTADEIQRQRQIELSRTIGGQRAAFGEAMAAAPGSIGQITPFARSAMEAQFDPFSAAYSLSQLTPMATGAAVPYPVGSIGGAAGGTTFQEWMQDPRSRRMGSEDWTGYLSQLAAGLPQGAFAADPAGGFTFTPSSLLDDTQDYTQDQLDQMDRMKSGWERLSDPVIGANIISQYAMGPGAAAMGGISPMARNAYMNALQDRFSAYQATPQGAVTPLMSKFLGGGFGLGYGV